MEEPTLALYDQDAYLDHFSAAVLSCEKDDQGEFFHVILDQTCFFPEQGGQSADTGRIGDNTRVLDVQIKNGVIDHLTDRPLSVGSVIEGRIDFTRRFGFMQHHTGEHIFSGLVYGGYGYHNVGFHLSERTVTMDYDGILSLEQARAVEWEANQVIWKNLPVQVSWHSPDELDSLSYRSKKKIDGMLRLVVIPEVDVCACCAPHVGRTGEIGQLRVIGLARYKGGTRIHIECGGRALLSARQDSDLLSAASRLLSCPPESLSNQISVMINREKELLRRMEEEKAADLTKRVEAVPPEKQNTVLYAGGISEKTAIAAADRLASLHQGVCGVLFRDGEDRRVVLASRTVSLKAAAQELRRSAGFKGGGDDSCIRGKTDMDDAQLEDWLNRYTGIV